jgi:RNA polymerase sigma factor (TIGR02999 family)
MSHVTEHLQAIDRGDRRATDDLLPIVYEELKRIAHAKLAAEKPGLTLGATALVHEAYLRLVGPAGPAGPEDPNDAAMQSRPAGGTYFDSRGHFFAAAAEAMRRILVEAARRRQSLKRGGNLARQDIDELDIPLAQPPEEVLAVHEALAKLAETNQRAAELVKLRYFAGFTIKEAAEILGIAPRTADDLWAYARAWLAAAIDEQ